MTFKENKTPSRVVKLADFDHRRLALEEFAEKRRLSYRRTRFSVGLDTESNTPKNDNGHGGTVVTLAERVGSFASIEIDELSALTPASQREAVMALLREHLAMEIGQYRITQMRRSFIVQYRSPDELIGVLLRVQYHLHQCTEGDLAAVGIPASFVNLNLTWGVGQSIVHADAERLKQRRRKRFTPER